MYCEMAVKRVGLLLFLSVNVLRLVVYQITFADLKLLMFKCITHIFAFVKFVLE